MSQVQPGRALAFEALVDVYAAARPTYPAELYDALPLEPGALVLELGAGTGLASAALLARGVRLLSTDLGPKMLRANGNPARAVARAEQLPVRSSSVSLVCGAQMWHWVARDQAVPEVRRVLADGGSVAMWWNIEIGDGRSWFDEQQTELETLAANYTRGSTRYDVEGPNLFRWERAVSVEDYLQLHRSRSYVDIMEPTVREGFLSREEARLRAAFPDGTVRQRYVTTLWLESKENL